MHYNLLFNGCSYTEGGELEGLYKDFEYRDRHRFSQIISNKTGLSHKNIARSGSSNDRIVRETLNWFNAGNTCDLAIIQLSTITRHEYISKYAQHGVNFNPKYITTKWQDDRDHEMAKVAHEHYFKYYYNHMLGLYNFYKNLYILEQFFEKHDIKYFLIKLRVDIINSIGDVHLKFFWSHLCKHDYYNIPTILNNILDTQDRSNFTKDYSNKDKIEKYKFFNGTHPSELGHQRIADFLIKELNK